VKFRYSRWDGTQKLDDLDAGGILDALSAGASGYLLKDAEPDELVRGVRAAAAGGRLVLVAVLGGALVAVSWHWVFWASALLTPYSLTHLREVQALVRLLQPVAPNTPTPPPPMVAPPAAIADADVESHESFLTRLLDSISPRPYAAPPITIAPTNKRSAADTPSSPDMFEAINKILQRRVRDAAYTTPLEIIGEGGELHIRYGDQVFLQVDAVPDERARTLIRTAVSEWEAT